MRRFLTVPTAILTVVLLIAGCTSSDDTAEEPTTAIPAATVAAPETATTVAVTATTSSSAVVSPETAIATVQALLDAYNAYDPDAALPLLRGDANDNGAYPGDPVWYRFNFDMPELVGTQAVLSEWAADDNGNVTCIRTWTDTLLSGKAGIVYSAAEEYHISAEGLITLRIGSERIGSEGPAGVEDNEAFEEALGEWLVIAHPEAYERFYVPAFNSKNAENWNSPDGVAELSQLIDEFIAQSDEYPLTATADENVFAVTFNGSKCTTEDLPSELPAGNYTFVLTNLDDDKTGDFGMRKYIGEKAGITEAEVNALIEEMGGDGAYPLGSYDWLEGAVIDFHAERLELEPNQVQYDFILEPGSYWMRSNTSGPQAHWHCGVVIVTAP